MLGQLPHHSRALYKRAIAKDFWTLFNALLCSALALLASQIGARRGRSGFSEPVADKEAVLTQAPLHSIKRTVQVSLRALVRALHRGKAAAVDAVVDLQGRAGP